MGVSPGETWLFFVGSLSWVIALFSHLVSCRRSGLAAAAAGAPASLDAPSFSAALFYASSKFA